MMSQAAAMLYLYVESRLHAGTGQSLGLIDQPIQRERPTDYPEVHSSGVKGALRARAQGGEREKDTDTAKTWNLIFGPDTSNADEHAGALITGDARILLFPIRSLRDVFVYATSVDVLARFQSTYSQNASLDWPSLASVEPGPGEALITPAGAATLRQKLVLEEFSFNARSDDKLSSIVKTLSLACAGPAVMGGQQGSEGQQGQATPDTYWTRKLNRSLVILSNDDFRDFARYATEVLVHVRIDPETKTAAGTALWNQEYLPADSLLYAPVSATGSRRKRGDGEQGLSATEVITTLREGLTSPYLQLGGNETTGRGICRMTWEELSNGQQHG